jgi:hypothetical protein
LGSPTAKCFDVTGATIPSQEAHYDSKKALGDFETNLATFADLEIQKNNTQ